MSDNGTQHAGIEGRSSAAGKETEPPFSRAGIFAFEIDKAGASADFRIVPRGAPFRGLR